jgi:hypothetical protein
VAAVEIRGGKVGDLVAEHLEEHRGWGDGECLGEADHAAIEMDPAQGAAKPRTPYDLHPLSEVWKTPPVSQALEKAVNADPV